MDLFDPGRGRRLSSSGLMLAGILLGCLCWLCVVPGCKFTVGVDGLGGNPDDPLVQEWRATGREAGEFAGAATGLPFGAQIGGLLGDWGGWGLASIFGVGAVRKSKQDAEDEKRAAAERLARERAHAEEIARIRDATWDAAEAHTLARAGGLARGGPVAGAGPSAAPAPGVT